MLLASVLALSTGCETMSDWFGWGDDTAAEGELGTGTENVPGPYTEPGANVPSADKWTPTGEKLAPVYFAYDQATIGTAEQGKIQTAATFMKDNPDRCLIIEGNCDERGSLEYNRALGERRAISVRDALLGLGVPENRMQTISYGEERPAVKGNDEAAWAKNRRAELVPAK
jgi:peptidoglycan-associated lipoprotein